MVLLSLDFQYIANCINDVKLTATNTTMTAVDSTVTDSQRFYQVSLLP